MRKINYKSDFDFIVRLSDSEGEPMGFPSYDWTLVIHTEHFKAKTVTASQKGGVLTNCFNDGGAIHVVCDNHGLGKGALVGEFYAEVPNAIYADGIQLTVTPFSLGITLVDSASDSDGEIDVEAGLPVATINAYQMAQTAGYDGTMEDFVNALSNIGKVTNSENSTNARRSGRKNISPYICRKTISANSVAGNVYANNGFLKLQVVDVDSWHELQNIDKLCRMLEVNKERLFQILANPSNYVAPPEVRLTHDGEVIEIYVPGNPDQKRDSVMLRIDWMDDLMTANRRSPYVRIMPNSGRLEFLDRPLDKVELKPAPPVANDIFPIGDSWIRISRSRLEIQHLRKQRNVFHSRIVDNNRHASSPVKELYRWVTVYKAKAGNRSFSVNKGQAYTLIRARVRTKEGRVSDWVYWHHWSRWSKKSKLHGSVRMIFSGKSDKKIYHNGEES